MKRSEINQAIHTAMERLHEYKITLPCFGYWTVEDWKQKADITGRIRERMLGWDVTDFGSGDFYKVGLFLLTIRNGCFGKLL